MALLTATISFTSFVSFCILPVLHDAVLVIPLNLSMFCYLFVKVLVQQILTRCCQMLFLAVGKKCRVRSAGVLGNYYKEHMDKTKGEGGGRRGRWVWLGWSGGRKCRHL